MSQAQEEDFELDLKKYILIAIKRKGLILGACLAFIAVALTHSLRRVEFYEVSMLIAPPPTSISETGGQNSDAVASIKALIDSGVESAKIVKERGLSAGELRFDVSPSKDAKFLKISIFEPLDKAELGRDILSQLLKNLAIDYAKIIADKRSRIDNQIKLIVGQIDRKEGEIKLKNDQLRALEDLERRYLEQLRDSDSKREPAASLAAGKTDTATMLDAVAAQQRTMYALQIQSGLFDVRAKERDVLSSVDTLRSEINASRLELGSQNLLRSAIQNIQTIQDPYVSPRPLPSKSMQNVLVACLAGLVLGLTAAFAAEWWETA